MLDLKQLINDLYEGLIMLVKIDPEMIARNWPVIRYSIEQSMGIEDSVEQILFNLLTDRMACWAFLDNNSQVMGILTTTFMDNACNKDRSLWVYSIHIFGKVSKDVWLVGYKTLSKFAKSRKCNKIMALTDVDSVRNLASQLGGDVSQTLINVPLIEE